MGDLERRLERLEGRRSQGEEGKPWSPPEVYDRIREEAREDIEESLAAGEEPIYRITEDGEVQTRDGRTIRHYGDFIRALDERIKELKAQIAAEGRKFDPGPLTAEDRRVVEEKVTRRRGARRRDTQG